MAKLIAWIKAHKLTTVLLLVVAWFIGKDYLLPRRYQNLLNTGGIVEYASSLKTSRSSTSFLPMESAPAPGVQDRLVVRESSLSLLVKKVQETQKTIQQKAEDLGGYLVSSSVAQPEQSEAATGNITVRIPQVKLEEALSYFRQQGIRVVSENISGEDVTDEYVDIDARLATYLKTKIKFEAIMTKAEKVEDILTVQRELVNLQQQIDYLKGQQNYLEKSAANSRVTVYLATDELELPYAPSQTWRPKVIFKQAVRSLIAAVRKFGVALIWLTVYSIIWLPILIVYLLWRRRGK